jgi:CBS domain-containing protein
VEFVESGAVVVADGADPLDHLWVVRTGAVEVLDRGRVVDQLGTGDTFGHVSVLSGLPPALAVRAAEDTLLYRLPDPRTVLAEPGRLRFAHYGTLVSRSRLVRDGVLEEATRPVSRYLRPVVWCDATTTVRQAAELMTSAGQSCALVRTRDGLGIVTDQDFRRAFASGSADAESPVAGLASAPVHSVVADTSVSAAFIEMLQHGVHHLAVLGPAGVPVGVVRVVDLSSAELRDPLVVRGAVESAGTLDRLAEAARLLPSTVVELDAAGVPPLQIGSLLAAVTDAVLQRLVELCMPVDAGPEVSWLVLGSLARREPLPGSDVDTGMVWSDPDPAPAGSEDDVGDVVRAKAERVLAGMTTCGLSPCPDGANASNPLFSRSRAQWVDRATAWIAEPADEGALLLASIVTDSRPVTSIALGRAITDTIRTTARSNEFLAALLRLSLTRRPPTGFVRDFVVEHSGRRRATLDLKKRGLAPVVALGRWVAMVSGEVSGTTPQRLRRAADSGLLTVDEADTLVGAYTEFYSLLLHAEIAAIRSGTPTSTMLAPADLDTLARRRLRESFRAVSDVQARLHVDWSSRLL